MGDIKAAQSDLPGTLSAYEEGKVIADECGRADLQIVQDLPEGEGRDRNNVVRAVARAK